MHVPLDLMHEVHMHKSEGPTITKDRKTTGNTTSDTGESDQKNEAAPVAERPSAHPRPLSILSSLSFLKLRSSDASIRQCTTNVFQNGSCELTEKEVVESLKNELKNSDYASPVEKSKKVELLLTSNQLHHNLKELHKSQDVKTVKDCYANQLTFLSNTDKQSLSNNLSSKVVVKQAQNSRSGQNQVHSGEVSNIYGGVGSTVGFKGSFALYNSDGMCEQGRDLKMKEETVSLHNLDHDLKSARDNKGANVESWWRVEGGTLLEVRASHLLKLVCLLMFITMVIAFTFHSRIRQLEGQRTEIMQELNGFKMHLDILVERMDEVASLAIPTKSSRSNANAYLEKHEKVVSASETFVDVAEGEEFLEKVDGMNEKRVLVKRSAAAVRTTKGLQYPSSSISYNTLNNGSSAFDPMDNAWSTGVSPNDEKLKSSRGNSRNKSSSRKGRKLLRKQLKDLEAAHRIKLHKLKLKLRHSRLQLQHAKLSCCTENTSSSSHNLSNSPDVSGLPHKTGVRAAYLQIDGTSVNIKKPKQLIGPWYLPESGDEIGFNDLWYNNLALDTNGTAVVFEESGLYMIYAQLFYQLQRSPGSFGSPLGYRIYLRKNQSNSFKRPIPIAECVPSFPSTVYQTCFTQVTWFVEAQDEIYLEHFTDSLPMIDALRSGQTFLGIVQLSSN